jgi:hypothetical protein
LDYIAPRSRRSLPARAASWATALDDIPARLPLVGLFR